MAFYLLYEHEQLESKAKKANKSISQNAELLLKKAFKKHLNIKKGTVVKL